MTLGKFDHGGNIYQYQQNGNFNIEDFSANVNPMGLSPLGVKACSNWQSLAQHYPEPESASLAEKIAAFYQMPIESIVLGNGATELLYIMANLFRPAKTFVPAPTFSEYERAALSVNSKIFYWQREQGFPYARTLEENDWLCLCTPNNPDGRLLQSDEFIFLRDLVEERGAKMLIDESFIDFNPDLHSYREAVLNDQNILVLHSFTKFWAVPGLRIGCLFAHPTLIEQFKAKKDIWNINIMASSYLAAAIDDKEYYEDSRKFIMMEKERVYNMYRSLHQIGVCYPQANFMLLHLPSTITSNEMCKKVRQRGFLIRNCSNYEGLSSHDVRIAIRKQENNDRLFKIIKEILEEVN